MGANRMFSSRPPEPSKTESAPGTPAAGRSSGRGRVREIPRGIEVLVKKASVDPEFKDQFLGGRSQAAAAIGLRLDETEAAIVNSLPEKSLRSMIERTEVPRGQRKAFLGCVAAAMLAALGMVDTSAVEEIVVTGILPDRPGIKPILSWDGVSGRIYDIYYSEDLQNWHFLDTVHGLDGKISYTDREANWSGVDKRYYKIMVQSSSRGVSTDRSIHLEIKCERVPE